jgi:hypothetical protein
MKLTYLPIFILCLFCLTGFGQDQKINQLVKSIDDNPDILHLDYTPSVNELAEMGVPAMKAVLPLLSAKNELTRLHALRVLEHNVYNFYGFESGHGFIAKGGEDQVRKILLQLNYDWEEKDSVKRNSAIVRWRNYINGIESYNTSTSVLKSNELPEWLFYMKQLKHLSVSGMDCDYGDNTNCWDIGKVPPEIKNLVNLESLQLNMNGFEKIPASVLELTKLKSLDFTDNIITDITGISKLKNLEELTLFGCRLTSIPTEIKNLKKLKYLGLTGNNLSDDEINWLKREGLPNCKIVFEK